MLEDLDGITIRGILDRIDRDDDGRLVITDYKTGKAPPEIPPPPSSPSRSMPFSSDVAPGAQGASPSLSERAHLYKLDIDDRQLDAMDSQLRALWNAIDRVGHAKSPTRPGTLCNWCSFKEICPAFTGEAIALGKIPAPAWHRPPCGSP